jgi:hypothetical protein
MSQEIEFIVRIDEDGSDARRIDRLTAELRDVLDDEPGCTARHAERLSDRASPKSSLEIMPGAITLALTVAANLRVVAALLAQWIHRDDFKHMRLPPHRPRYGDRRHRHECRSDRGSARSNEGRRPQR